MSDLFVTSLAVFEAAIRVKSAHVIKSLKPIKIENMEVKDILSFRLYKYIEFTACLY